MDREEDDPVGEGEGLTPGVDLSALFASFASSEDGFGGCKKKKKKYIDYLSRFLKEKSKSTVSEHS